MENRFFRKSISFYRKIKALTRKLFYISIFISNHFRTQTRKERESERERERERESREPLTSRNQTCWRDRAEIAPHEACRRLIGLVLLRVRSSPPLGWSRHPPLADLSPPLGRSRCRSAFSLWSLIFFFFVVVVVVWVVAFWWFLCCVVVDFVWIVVDFLWV